MKKEQHFTPNWSKAIIWYQIFPERFRNGDPTNDPELDDIQGAYPFNISGPWQYILGVVTGINYRTGKVERT